MKKHRLLLTLLAGLLFIPACEQNDPQLADIQPQQPYELSAETKQKIDESVQIIRQYMQLERQQKKAGQAGAVPSSLPDLPTYLRQALSPGENVAQHSVPAAPPAAHSGRIQSSYLDPVTAEGYTVYAGPEHMSTTAQHILNNYHNELADVLFNSTYYPTENSVIQALQAKAQAAYNSASTASLSTLEREQLMAAFHGTRLLMWDAYTWVYENYPYPWEYGPEATGAGFVQAEGDVEASDTLVTTMGIFGKKGPRFWRAVVRVVLAVAVAAVIVAIPIAAMAVATALSTGSPLVIGSYIGGVLLKGFTVGSFTVASTLGSALYAGFNNAAKNWDKPWQGANEFVFGLKIKPIYH